MEKVFEIYIRTTPNSSGMRSRTPRSVASSSSATQSPPTGRLEGGSR